MQMAHKNEMPNLFTSPTDDWWRLIRKGLSPAFSANNLRCCYLHVCVRIVPAHRTFYRCSCSLMIPYRGRVDMHASPEAAGATSNSRDEGVCGTGRASRRCSR